MKIHVGMCVYPTMGVHPETVRNIVQFDLESQERKNDLTLHFPQTFSLAYSRNIDLLCRDSDCTGNYRLFRYSCF